MLRLASLAALRAQPLGPALRPLVRRVSPGRLALTAGIAVAVAALAYVVARETSIFAVEKLAVGGAPADVRREIRAELEDVSGASLVEVDSDDVVRRLRELPSVLDARVDRSFPHTLSVRVVPEEPLAVVKSKGAAWIVSERGRVIRASEESPRAGLPRVTSAEAVDLAPGEYVADAATRLSLRALAAVPANFPGRVRSAREDESNLTFVLRPSLELRLGSIDDLDLKLEAARAVLGSMARSERRALAHLDVSLPQRPVATSKHSSLT